MDKKSRIYIYAFLSRVFADELDIEYLEDLKANDELLLMLGSDTKEWFDNNSIEEIKQSLNIDFSTIFLMNAKAIETSVIDAKDEILVGLQNPVMQFYFTHNFDLNLAASNLQTPDHISIELAFMQNLISNDEEEVQKEFMQKHLVNWSIPYFIGIKDMTTTPFYRDLCDFYIEFISTDFEEICSKV